MFFTRQTKIAKIYPVFESETDSSDAEAGTDVDLNININIESDVDDNDDNYTYNNTLAHIDEDLSQIVVYTIMDQLLCKNIFCNEFGVIDLSNIDEFETELFEIKNEKGKTYGFKVSPKGFIIISGTGSMYDGIISSHCEHDVEKWLPMFHPILDHENANIDWYVFMNSSFCL